MRLKDVKGELNPGLSRWALNAITRIHIKEAGVLSQTQRKDNVETEHGNEATR